MRKSVYGVVVIAGLLLSVSSASLFGQGAAKEKSLYDRLGGKKSIVLLEAVAALSVARGACACSWPAFGKAATNQTENAIIHLVDTRFLN